MNSRIRLRKCFWVIVVGALLMASIEGGKQYRESREIKAIAADIVQKAGAYDNHSRVIALRDYLRKRVTFRDVSEEGRPFLRATAIETLRSGKGFCGEVSRAFIRLANALGIQAQRVNLYGRDNHVVVEAELRPGERVIVDSQFPPHLPDLEPLDRVILRPEYDDYSTLHLRRLHLTWLVSRVKLQMGMLTYWAENPHAIKSALWMIVALTLLIGRFIFVSGRSLAIRLLVRRGWVKVGTTPEMDPVVTGLAD